MAGNIIFIDAKSFEDVINCELGKIIVVTRGDKEIVKVMRFLNVVFKKV